MVRHVSVHVMKYIMGISFLMIASAIGLIGYKCCFAGRAAVQPPIETKTTIRVLAPESLVSFKLPDGWYETVRFVDPENGNTIYLRNGRMIVVPKNGTKALADTDPD